MLVSWWGIGWISGMSFSQFVNVYDLRKTNLKKNAESTIFREQRWTLVTLTFWKTFLWIFHKHCNWWHNYHIQRNQCLSYHGFKSLIGKRPKFPDFWVHDSKLVFLSKYSQNAHDKCSANGDVLFPTWTVEMKLLYVSISTPVYTPLKKESWLTDICMYYVSICKNVYVYACVPKTLYIHIIFQHWKVFLPTRKSLIFQSFEWSFYITD